MIQVLMLLFPVAVFGRQISLPPYLKPCSISSPDFEACCLQHGRDALPMILKGDKKLGIPNLLPLVVPHILVDAGKNLKIAFEDIHVFGLDGIDLKQVKIDIKTRKATLKLDVPQLELIGKYEVDGKLLVLPIKGKGDVNMTAIGGHYQYDFEFSTERINGIDHLVVLDNDVLKFELEGAKIRLDNLFDGDKVLGEQMNTFLNDNWKDVIDELGGAVSQTVRSLGRNIASRIFKKVPYKELILD
ncbi:protein takeout isoform X2 [Leptinotarsa decemlineata]|uniref:protein takeout isoform X2 n=1 Tax=Leptinotarsa decemlineata TaxID=7539 RepID=UPI003D3069B4